MLENNLSYLQYASGQRDPLSGELYDNSGAYRLRQVDFKGSGSRGKESQWSWIGESILKNLSFVSTTVSGDFTYYKGSYKGQHNENDKYYAVYRVAQRDIYKSIDGTVYTLKDGN